MEAQMPDALIETVAQALFEAAGQVLGARVPIIAAEELARAALTAILNSGYTFLPLPSESAAVA